LSFRSFDLIADPGKNVACCVLESVDLKIRIATPLPGALFIETVVALDSVKAVLSTPSRETLTSDVEIYGKVKAKIVFEPLPV
tara:strand:- start:65 stop:313 length:249 start_codon:yes stop_codon:yes gene_type:complete